MSNPTEDGNYKCVPPVQFNNKVLDQSSQRICTHPTIEKIPHLQRRLVSKHQTPWRDLIKSKNELRSTNDDVTGELVDRNLVQFLHTSLEREGGAKPLGNGIPRHECASIKGQANG